MEIELHTEHIRCFKLADNFSGYELALKISADDKIDKFIDFIDSHECKEIVHTARVYHDCDICELVTFRDFIAISSDD